MTSGLPWSEAFIRDLSEKEFRNEFVADQVRLRIATLIRALREQHDRDWSQARLGQEMGKPQSVVSRIEDPDYGKLSLQTLFDVAAAFDLPLWVDIPEWEDWFQKIRDVPNSKTSRRGFDAGRILSSGAPSQKSSAEKSNVCHLDDYRQNALARSNGGTGNYNIADVSSTSGSEARSDVLMEA